MKKIKTFIFFILSLFILTGCSNQYFNGKVHYFESSSGKEENNEFYLVETKDMLNEYVRLENQQVLDDLSFKFNDEYFENNSLIIVYIIESSGSNSLKVKSFSIDNETLNIVIKRITPGPNEAGTCDIRYHHIVFEITKEEALSIKDYNLNIIE